MKIGVIGAGAVGSACLLSSITRGIAREIVEDVGRHNAVDKVIGRMLIQERLPLSGYLLFVSGRTSFEIIQKAFLAEREGQQVVEVFAAVRRPGEMTRDQHGIQPIDGFDPL
jgi:FdhD protein